MASNAQTCYFPDGSVSHGDIPCNSSASSHTASACCGHLDVCLDNHLCLAQNSAEVISRGSCTDRTWQSAECSQYCADVSPNRGTPIRRTGADGHPLFCCSEVDVSSETCKVGTKGSTAPFFIQAGLVIFNRTSGSTSLDNATTISATITVTAIATASALSSSSDYTAPSFSLSKTDVAIGAGVSGLLGLGLIVALGLLWMQRKHKHSFKDDALTWKERYTELKETGNLSRAEHRPPHELDGLKTNGLDAWSHFPCQPHLPGQLEGWTPDEVDGAQVHELADRAGRT